MTNAIAIMMHAKYGNRWKKVLYGYMMAAITDLLYKIDRTFIETVNKLKKSNQYITFGDVSFLSISCISLNVIFFYSFEEFDKVVVSYFIYYYFKYSL